MKIDYNKKMEETINSLSTNKKKLLLHSCCAPCNTGALAKLYKKFDITIYFYNPNINVPGEFEARYLEQERYIEESGLEVKLIKGEFEPEKFLEAIKGHEKDGERSIRCIKCFEFRLEKACQMAKELKMDYFASSLTLSPMKDAKAINELGEKWSDIYKVNWLHSDFKKKDGYKCSIELSKKYNLYRQNYCGCAFSKAENNS